MDIFNAINECIDEFEIKEKIVMIISDTAVKNGAEGYIFSLSVSYARWALKVDIKNVCM